MRSDQIAGIILAHYEKKELSKELIKLGFYLDQEVLMNPSIRNLKSSIRKISEKFEIKHNLRNNKLPLSKKYKEELQNQLSKFNSRYEIAYYMNKISVKKTKNNPFQKNKGKRLSSYSSMIKFLLTYSAYESFLSLFNYKEKLDKNVYALIDKDKSNRFIDSLKTRKSNKLEILLTYLMENIEDQNNAFRVSIFLGKSDLEKIDKTGKNLYINSYKKLYTELEQLFGKKKSYKHDDILLIPRLLRHKIAHGDLTASYNPRNSKNRLDFDNMIAMYNSINDLLFSIMDTKFNQILNRLKSRSLV